MSGGRETELLLREIALELREIRLDVRAMKEFVEGLVIETIPAPVRQLPDDGRDALPDGFPSRDALAANGIASLDTVPRTAARLKRLDGIGPNEATAILRALPKYEKEFHQ